MAFYSSLVLLPRPAWPSIAMGSVNEDQPWLGGKAGMVHSAYK